MSRKSIRWWVLCLLVLLACSCGVPVKAEPSQVASHVVVDMAGREVRIPDDIRRIACLEVLCYEKLFLLGASDRIAMMVKTNAPWMKQTNPAMTNIQQLASDASSEELLRQHVDVVFRTNGYPNPAKIERLAQMGVPILASQAGGKAKIDSIESFVESRKQMLRLFAQVLGPGYEARAEAWCVYHDKMVEMVLSRTRQIPANKRVRLFHVRGPQATNTQGMSTNTYWYGEIAGADMVVKQNLLLGRGQGSISIEEILKWDPQVINIGRMYSADLVTKDARWAQISAVRTGQVHELPEGVFYWDGSTEGVLLMLYLAKELYPDLFPDLNLKRKIRNYYARFYRYHISERELDLMLAGKGPDGKRFNDMNN